MCCVIIVPHWLFKLLYFLWASGIRKTGGHLAAYPLSLPLPNTLCFRDQAAAFTSKDFRISQMARRMLSTLTK